ncbi:hypothetical protein HZU73_00814 [Apis mellifera caucasica]|uniref:Uncharacterized protein LOC100576126 n=1 Tax=Apis mellifera TaxID=7460 RepID=A0A7M7MLT4_APIME|nr:uncharacterized protein LOC100576126 [Apis mellifera]KAG6804100.1 hypothetical protein HZU73_00814 [Apis mellifera caucasica]KAG9437122.1 hypothetical protein HZU67_00131 [Apis mellifera carnica]|eukprot:XP_026297916.1 uncharacterized protein LOC100576126 [Apis mellifera]
MFQEHFLTVLFGAVMSITVPSTGFSPERSEFLNAQNEKFKVNIPATWNVVPSLETDQKITVDHTSSPKTEVTGIDKGLQISDTKVSTKTIEQTSPADAAREKRFDFVIDNGKNINIVMIIADPGQDQEEFWKNFKASHLFSVEGMVQSCNNNQVDKIQSRFSLDDALISANRDKKHDCEHMLRSNIASLLLWTRDVKGMTTGTLSNGNFTIPSLFGFEETVGLSKEFDEIEENNMKPEIHKLKPEIRDWHVIDVAKPTNRVSSFMSTQSNREDDEAAWNVFDMFSKIRMVLFRSLLESLGNVGASEEPIPSRRAHFLRSNLMDMVEELKSVENEKGFILVASVPASEVNSALENLQREAQDTLVIVTGVCTHDGKPVPYFARGPSAKIIREATKIWDIPNAIRSVIANGCQDCKNRRHDVSPPPIAQLKIVPHNLANFKRSLRDTVKKSDDDKKLIEAPVNKNEIIKTVADLSAKEETKNEDTDLLPKLETSSANFKMADKFTTILGIILSMVGAFTLTS